MRRFIKQHKRRFAVIAVALLSIALFYAVRGNKQWMTVYVDRVTSPLKRFLAMLFSALPLSLAEVLVMGFILFCFGFAIWMIAGCVRAGKEWWKHVISMVITGAAIGLVIASLMNLLWGANYYALSFKERSGIEANGCTVEELDRMTTYFAELVNETAPRVNRGEDGLYCAEINVVLKQSAAVFRPVEESFPFLKGRELVPRAVWMSEAMSWIETTGVTFPFTGECCINVHAPLPFLASTAAHEIAHQRGVASEDEANFLAVLVCLMSDEADFRYSGSMLGYVTLSNALVRVDPERAREIRSSLCPEADADLRANNAYWRRYETKVSEVSDQMYDKFLKDYDQPLGIQSYGAAADLLVAWYREEA